MQIVKIIEAKDVYTAGHSMRVARYCEKIARRMRLNEYDIELVKNLASLHDIGKDANRLCPYLIRKQC